MITLDNEILMSETESIYTEISDIIKKPNCLNIDELINKKMLEFNFHGYNNVAYSGYSVNSQVARAISIYGDMEEIKKIFEFFKISGLEEFIKASNICFLFVKNEYKDELREIIIETLCSLEATRVNIEILKEFKLHMLKRVTRHFGDTLIINKKELSKIINGNPQIGIFNREIAGWYYYLICKIELIESYSIG